MQTVIISILIYFIVCTIMVLLKKLIRKKFPVELKLVKPDKISKTIYYLDKRYIVVVWLFYGMLLFFLIAGLVVASNKKDFTTVIILAVIIILSTFNHRRMIYRFKRTCLIIDEISLSYNNGLEIKNKVLLSEIKDVNIVGADLVIDTKYSKFNVVIPCYFEKKIELLSLLKSIIYFSEF